MVKQCYVMSCCVVLCYSPKAEGVGNVGSVQHPSSLMSSLAPQAVEPLP